MSTFRVPGKTTRDFIQKNMKPEVIMIFDSILGVSLNFYEIRGLKAEITLEEPDTTDTSVYLYSRCADHGKNNEYLGSLVTNGNELQDDNTRLGYSAMANDNIVIVSLSVNVKGPL